MEAEIKKEREALDQRVKKEEEGSEEDGDKVKSRLDLGTGLERREEVERMWDRGVEGLGGLGGVTGILARLERAEKALGVVEGT